MQAEPVPLVHLAAQHRRGVRRARRFGDGPADARGGCRLARSVRAAAQDERRRDRDTWETLLDRNPATPLRALALYRLGWAYRNHIVTGFVGSSDVVFSALVKGYPGSELAALATAAKQVPSKSPTTAAAWSILPGAGQIYAGEYRNEGDPARNRGGRGDGADSAGHRVPAARPRHQRRLAAARRAASPARRCSRSTIRTAIRTRCVRCSRSTSAASARSRTRIPAHRASSTSTRGGTHRRRRRCSRRRCVADSPGIASVLRVAARPPARARAPFRRTTRRRAHRPPAPER